MDTMIPIGSLAPEFQLPDLKGYWFPCKIFVAASLCWIFGQPNAHGAGE
jgi:hypothetical protein